jgi:hypothetical protein
MATGTRKRPDRASDGNNDHERPPPCPAGEPVKPDGPHSAPIRVKEPMDTASMRGIPKLH